MSGGAVGGVCADHDYPCDVIVLLPFPQTKFVQVLQI